MSDVHAQEVELAPFVVPLDHDYRRLLDAIGDRRFVLLGEASHGSKELYLVDKRLRPAIFGLDLYSLHASVDVVLGFRDAHRPPARA